MGKIRVFVLDDHNVVREGVRQVLSTDAGVELIGEAGTAKAGIDAIIGDSPDVAIIDVRLPDGDGVDVARHVHSVDPSVRCLMFTGVTGEDAFLRSAIAGAMGYILKDADGPELLAAIKKVARGESLIDAEMLEQIRSREAPSPAFEGFLSRLTPHERRLLRLVVEGQTNREIAEQLHLAEKTVRNYVSSILGKVGVKNRTQLAVYVSHLMDAQGS